MVLCGMLCVFPRAFRCWRRCLQNMRQLVPCRKLTISCQDPRLQAASMPLSWLLAASCVAGCRAHALLADRSPHTSSIGSVAPIKCCQAPRTRPCITSGEHLCGLGFRCQDIWPGIPSQQGQQSEHSGQRPRPRR